MSRAKQAGWSCRANSNRLRACSPQRCKTSHCLPRNTKSWNLNWTGWSAFGKTFPSPKTSLFAELKGSLKSLTAEEYDGWLAEGRFESRDIDGQRFFALNSVSNLYFRYPELSDRRMPPKDTAALQKARLESCTAIRRASVTEQKPYVLPKRST